MEDMKKARFSAGRLTFAVRHELWDGNIQDHPDQGVAILVMADVGGKETTLLRFNCFDFERSYIYGPETADLRVEGPAMLGGAAATNLYRTDSLVDGLPDGVDRARPPDRLDHPNLGDEAAENAGARGLSADCRDRRYGGGDEGPAGRRSLCPRITRDEAKHRQAQPRHPHLRGW